MNNSLYRIISILAIVALVILGCSRTTSSQYPEIADTSFLTGQPCPRPCWYGLEIGKSTVSEAMAVLSSLPFVDPSSIKKWDNSAFDFYSQGTEILFDCNGSHQGCGYLRFYNDNLKIINHQIQYALTIQSTVELLGEPTYIFHVPATTDGGGCLLELGWPQQQIATRSITTSYEPLCIDLDHGKGVDPNVNITEVFYAEPEFFQLKPCNNNTCPPWPGFK